MVEDTREPRFKWQDAVGLLGLVLAVAAMTDMPIALRLCCFAAGAVFMPLSFFSHKDWPRLVRWLLSVGVVALMGFAAWHAWAASRPKADVFLEWKQPAPMEAGSALNEHQLDAVAKYNGKPVAGNYVYNPAFGATLPTGTDTLSVEFIPRDPKRFNSANETVVVVVKEAHIPPAPSTSKRKRNHESQGLKITQNGRGNQSNPVIVNGPQTTTGYGSPIINGSNNTTSSPSH